MEKVKTQEKTTKRSQSKREGKKAIASPVCKSCGTKIALKTRGRPRSYCSDACRRAAEYEIRRVNTRIARLEDTVSNARTDPVTAKLWDIGLIAQEIDLQKARLRELLE